MPPELEDSRQLLVIAFIADITAKLNENDTELEGTNDVVIKVSGTIEPFKEN